MIEDLGRPSVWQYLLDHWWSSKAERIRVQFWLTNGSLSFVRGSPSLDSLDRNERDRCHRSPPYHLAVSAQLPRSQPSLEQVRECLAKHETLAAAMGEMIPKAYAAAGERGIPPAGPTVSAYFTWDPTDDGKTRFTCGPTVAADSPEPEGDGLGVRTIAGCKCAVTVHTGPYSELMKAYEATFGWIEAKGFEHRMPCIETYENNPEDTEPSKLRTKICIPVVPKAAP